MQVYLHTTYTQQQQHHHQQQHSSSYHTGHQKSHCQPIMNYSSSIIKLPPCKACGISKQAVNEQESEQAIVCIGSCVVLCLT